MKYAENKVAGIDSETLQKLEQIAMNACYTLEKRGGIDTRNNDDEDFPEIGINAIQQMLEKAYLLGKYNTTEYDCDEDDE